jgi:hypothetical protein
MLIPPPRLSGFRAKSGISRFFIAVLRISRAMSDTFWNNRNSPSGGCTERLVPLFTSLNLILDVQESAPEYLFHFRWADPMRPEMGGVTDIPFKRKLRIQTSA